MESKGCNTCKHLDANWASVSDDGNADVRLKCLKGKTEEFKDWWISNQFNSEEELTEMSCYEPDNEKDDE